MEKILCLLIIGLSVHFASAQTKREIADRKIKSVLIKWDDTRNDSTGKKSELTKYDRRGNPIEVIEKDKTGKIVKWEKASFDKHGNKTSSEQLNPSGKTIKITIIKYDRKGNEINNERIDSVGRPIKKIETTYDKWGNVIEKKETNASGEITDWEKSAYNNVNDKVSEISLDKNGKELKKAVYEYDSKGMLKSKKIYDDKEALIYSREYTYEY